MPAHKKAQKVAKRFQFVFPIGPRQPASNLKVWFLGKSFKVNQIRFKAQMARGAAEVAG
jgi:hypothetical protein